MGGGYCRREGGHFKGLSPVSNSGQMGDTMLSSLFSLRLKRVLFCFFSISLLLPHGLYSTTTWITSLKMGHTAGNKTPCGVDTHGSRMLVQWDPNVVKYNTYALINPLRCINLLRLTLWLLSFPLHTAVQWFSIIHTKYYPKKRILRLKA